MVIVNKTSLTKLPALVEEVVRHVEPKRTGKLAIAVYWGRGKTSFSGSAIPHAGHQVPKAVNKALDGMSCDGYLVVGCPKEKITAYEQWVVEFTQTIYHEVSHIWDAQANGTRHWRYDIRWEDRPQEMIAMFQASRKFGELPPSVKAKMEELVTELKELKP